MEKIIIRPALENDCARMFELVEELAIFEKAADQITINFKSFCHDGFGARPIWKAFVAEVDGKIEGMSLFYERYSTWKGRRLYLEDLIVTESRRGNGIGTKLFDATINYGRKNSYSGMVLQVLNWNTAAIEFYKKYASKIDDQWANVSIEF